MPTPAQHKATGITLLAAATATRSAFQVSASDSDFDMIAAHAALGHAAGTGTEYTNAEAAIDLAATYSTDGAQQLSYWQTARVARAHALLAD